MKRFVILLLALLGSLWGGPVSLGHAESALPQNGPNPVITLEVDLSANGSTLLSIPLDLGKMNVGRWLEDDGLAPTGIHGWDARSQSYIPLKTLRPGEGFLLARGPGKVSIWGQRIVTDSVELPLEKGWNLIGTPYETSIPLVSLRIDLKGKIKPYKSAAEGKWVGGINTLIDGQMLPVAVNDSARLEPWRGYWLYAYQPCILQIPSAQSTEKTRGGKPKL